MSRQGFASATRRLQPSHGFDVADHERSGDGDVCRCVADRDRHAAGDPCLANAQTPSSYLFPRGAKLSSTSAALPAAIASDPPMVTSISMIGFAASPGTAVLPIWSIAITAEPSRLIRCFDIPQMRAAMPCHRQRSRPTSACASFRPEPRQPPIVPVRVAAAFRRFPSALGQRYRRRYRAIPHRAFR